MDTQELTQIATAHQQAIDRHEQWQTEHETRMARIEQHLEATAAQQALNTQAIATLTASILDLRNLVADYIQSRNQTE